MLPRMTLREYLDWKGLSPEAFGQQINVSRVAVVRYLNGERRPRWDKLPEIVKATGGLVTADSFLDKSPRARRVA